MRQNVNNDVSKDPPIEQRVPHMKPAIGLAHQESLGSSVGCRNQPNANRYLGGYGFESSRISSGTL